MVSPAHKFEPLPQGRIRFVIGRETATFMDGTGEIVVARSALDTRKLFAGLAGATVVRAVLKHGDGVIAQPLLSPASRRLFEGFALVDGAGPGLMANLHIVGSTTMGPDSPLHPDETDYDITLAVDPPGAGHAAGVFWQAHPDSRAPVPSESNDMTDPVISPERLAFLEADLQRQVEDPASGWRSNITAEELSGLLAENRTMHASVRRLEGSVAVLEKFRPHWAKGFTNDSMAAQSHMSATLGMWEELGVENQTQAIQAIRDLMAFKAEHDDVEPSVPGL